MVLYYPIDELLAESRRTAERSRELIDEARRIREQTRQLRLTMGDLVAEQHDNRDHIGRNGGDGETNQS